jgi:hypothetical protein
MFFKKITLLSITLASIACSAESKKSDTDWAVKCKPVSDAIQETGKTGRYNLSGVEGIFQKNNEYPNCRDGFYGEGMSDIVVKSLANDFINIANSASPKAELSEFIVRHIDSTTDWSDLDKITKNAVAVCPSKAKSLCIRIKEKSISASREAKAAGAKAD